MGPSDRRSGQIERLTAWIESADALAAARSELEHIGLRGSGLVGDLLSTTWLKVHDRIGREPLDDRRDTDPVAGYARRTLRNAAVDLVRGPKEISLDELVQRGWQARSGIDGPGLDDAYGPDGSSGLGGGHSPGEDPWSWTSDDDPLGQQHDRSHDPSIGPSIGRPIDTRLDPERVEEITVEEVRRGLHARIPERYVEAWVVAAALATVTVRDDAVVLAADVPQPQPASPGWARRHLWAGLAYAGQDRCFAQPENGAVRERRSRAVQRVERLLRAEVDRAVALVSAADAAEGEEEVPS